MEVMRIYHPTPDTSVIYLDVDNAKVNVHWDAGKMVIQQPRHLGGKLEKSLDEYESFDGDLRAFVLAQRKEVS